MPLDEPTTHHPPPPTFLVSGSVPDAKPSTAPNSGASCARTDAVDRTARISAPTPIRVASRGGRRMDGQERGGRAPYSKRPCTCERVPKGCDKGWSIESIQSIEMSAANRDSFQRGAVDATLTPPRPVQSGGSGGRAQPNSEPPPPSRSGVGWASDWGEA